MVDRHKNDLQQTAESLKLLGAGSAYRDPTPISSNDLPVHSTFDSVEAPWGQRYPQGKWK